MLLVLLAVAIAGVLGYVINRRATLRAQGPTTPKVVGPLTPGPVIDLKQHDGKTIDFSGVKPVISDTAEDRAALEQGLKDIEEARKNVTFEAEKPAPKKP